MKGISFPDVSAAVESLERNLAGFERDRRSHDEVTRMSARVSAEMLHKMFDF